MHMCGQMPSEARREHWTPALELWRRAWHACWDLNLGLWKSRGYFLTSEASLQILPCPLLTPRVRCPCPWYHVTHPSQRWFKPIFSIVRDLTEDCGGFSKSCCPYHGHLTPLPFSVMKLNPRAWRGGKRCAGDEERNPKRMLQACAGQKCACGSHFQRLTKAASLVLLGPWSGQRPLVGNLQFSHVFFTILYSIIFYTPSSKHISSFSCFDSGKYFHYLFYRQPSVSSSGHNFFLCSNTHNKSSCICQQIWMPRTERKISYDSFF